VKPEVDSDLKINVDYVDPFSDSVLLNKKLNLDNVI
jgi:hypothetical protein